MAIFDFYIMVDWSGGNSRTANRPNCIWLAQGASENPQPATESPRSRTEAINRVIQLACQFLDAQPNGRVLACLDFAFGYPQGFAEHLPDGNGTPLWARVWEYLAENIQDDVETQQGRPPTNRSNRFDIGNQLNGLIGGNGNLGPFWCAEPNWRESMQEAGQPILIPQNQPQNFVSNAGVAIPKFRISDLRVQSDFPFRLFGNGSVGSQMLTGIPPLQQLRQSPEITEYGVCCAWPFETGWAVEDGPWLRDDVRLVLAEIYPSVRQPLADTILDRGQVRAMWHWARDIDNDDELIDRFQRPENLADNEELIVRCEEGWILH